MKTLNCILLCLVVLACGTPFAAAQLLSDGQENLQSGDSYPDVANTAGLKTIYSNLGPGDAYDINIGTGLNGPKCTVCVYAPEWLAMPFTPKANATVTQIQVAVQNVAGTDGFSLVLAADRSGVPGKTLHSWDLTHVLPYGVGCCKLDTVKYAKGIVVKKGKHYWVVGRSDSKNADTHNWWLATWNDSSGTYALLNSNTNGVWASDFGIVFAFAVQGR